MKEIHFQQILEKENPKLVIRNDGNNNIMAAGFPEWWNWCTFVTNLGIILSSGKHKVAPVKRE